MELFEDGLKDIYFAEKALIKAIPTMIGNATLDDLIDASTNHLAETENQVIKLESVFASIDKNAEAVKYEAMVGLMKEASEIMEQCEEGSMRNDGIISAAQKVEHYEIATYGTLRQFAETLGLTKAMPLLEETFDEEKAADIKLIEVAVEPVNIDTAEIKTS